MMILPEKITHSQVRAALEGLGLDASNVMHFEITPDAVCVGFEDYLGRKCGIEIPITEDDENHG